MTSLSEPIYIPLWLAIVGITPQVITSIFGFINGRRATRLEGKVESLHREVNGRMTELLDVTKTSAHAKGVLEERERIP